MPTIYVDDQPYEVKAGENLLYACLSLGLDLPYFCWHPALGSVGACRQCAIKQFKDEQDRQGRLVMACMTPVEDEARISIQDPEAKAFRASVIEWLMTNHPHDCPICDEGGECHLQDMTVMTGHTYREYRFKKRTYRNQYLGPFINHEMNRCIQCYRCVRFYRDYAGGRDLDAFASRNHVYFGRHKDGVLESEFSGNLVEICPTGVFTDKTLKQHYTRKWDLQTAPSVCVHCGLGCNTTPGERYGRLRRIRNRYNGAVNEYFLCDRGRYGYEFVNSERRIRRPLLRQPGSNELEPTARETALRYLGASLVGDPRSEGRRSDRAYRAEADKVIGIGSPRASLEANFALRALVGPDRFYLGLAEKEANLITLAIKILQAGPARSPSLEDVRQADAVLVLGEDLINVAPLLALAVRQSVHQEPMEIAEALNIPAWQDAAVREAIQDEKGPLFIATPCLTKLDEMATRTYHAAPDDLARLGFAVAHALDAEAPAVPNLSEPVRSLAEEIAQVLGAAKRPLVISGTSCNSEAIIQAAANVAWALGADGQPAELCLTMPECNSLGLGLMGGQPLEAAFEAARTGAAETVIILENDLYRRAAAEAVDAFLEAAKNVIVIDHLTNDTTMKAEVVLPASTFAEGDGTLVNNEGRAQRFFQVFVPAGEIQESWRWLLGDLSKILVEDSGSDADRSVKGIGLVSAGPAVEDPGSEGQRSDRAERAWRKLDEVIAALAEAMPVFRPIREITPPADFRLAGQKIPRQPHRYSGRTAIRANIDVHEPKPPNDPDSALAFSMEGYAGQPPPPLIPFYWAPGWNSVQALNKFQAEVGGPLQGGDPGQRLIEPAPVEPVTYFRNPPDAFVPRTGEWFIVPLYHIFGSEPFSMFTPGVAELAPEPYLALSADDAAGLQVEADQTVELTINGTSRSLPVKVIPTLPTGIAGLPAGFRGWPSFLLPGWYRVD